MSFVWGALIGGIVVASAMAFRAHYRDAQDTTEAYRAGERHAWELAQGDPPGILDDRPLFLWPDQVRDPDEAHITGRAGSHA